MCSIPEEIITVFIKTMKIHYVLKGTNGNPETRTTKKGSQQQTTTLATSSFHCRFTIRSYRNVHKSQAKTSGRGPSGSALIIFKRNIKVQQQQPQQQQQPTTTAAARAAAAATTTTTTITLTHSMGRILPTRGSSWRGLLPPLRGGNLFC